MDQKKISRRGALKFGAAISAAAAVGVAPQISRARAQGETERYGMVVFLKGSEFFNWCYAGMIDAAARIGGNIEVELQGPAEWDASLEARAIEQLLAKGVDGVLATAGDAQVMNPAINRAIGSGIPVVLFDSDAPESDRLAFCGTENYAAGYEAGLAVAEWLGDDARVGISTFPGPDHLVRRIAGFTDALAAAAPGAQIVQTVNDEGKVEVAETALTAMLQANPEINAIFAAHGNPGPGAAAAVRTLGREGEVHIMGFDFGLPVIELIEAGEIRATVGQNPYLMGYMSMMVAYGARVETDVPLFGEGFGPHPKGIDTGVNILYADDVGIFKNPPQF
jgi:ribose transport system substrate-binding protein